MLNRRFGPIVSQVLAFLFVIYLSRSLCPCENEGKCKNHGIVDQCICKDNYLGDKCQYSSQMLREKPTNLYLKSNFTYLHFQPTEKMFYRLKLNICMLANPREESTLMYMEVEKDDGSIKEAPYFYEVVRLKIGELQCVEFSTHYINFRMKQDFTFKKLIVGFKILSKEETNPLMRVVSSETATQSSIHGSFEVKQKSLDQKISVSMVYEKYEHDNYFRALITLMSIFLLLIGALGYLVFQTNRQRQLFLMTYLQRQFVNPNQKNNLSHFELLMPPFKYDPQIKHDMEETCSICLINFKQEDEMRLTPCQHVYHKQCIDDWCLSKLSCPNCRKQLNFDQKSKQKRNTSDFRTMLAQIFEQNPNLYQIY